MVVCVDVLGPENMTDSSLSGSWSMVDEPNTSIMSSGASSASLSPEDEVLQNMRSVDVRDCQQFDVRDQDVIVVVGKTLSGKSMFIKFIACDNSTLFSEADVANGANFLIKEKEDYPGRETDIGWTGTSTTMFPSIILDERNRAAFGDFPGFGDTRGPVIEFKQTFLMRKLLREARGIKLAVLVDYHNMVGGNSVDDFLVLVESLVGLVQNIEKYGSAICFVASKVPSSTIKVAGNYVLVPDGVMLQQIVEFLKSVKVALSSPKRLHMGASLRGRCMKLLDMLLTDGSSDANSTARLGLFRRPDEAGPLDKVQLLQDGKRDLEELLFSRIVYVQPEPDDFGFPLSARCRVALDRVIGDWRGEMVQDARLVAGRLKEHVLGLLRELWCPEDAMETLEGHFRCLDAVSEHLCGAPGASPGSSPQAPLCSCCASDTEEVRQALLSIRGHLGRIRDFQEVIAEDVVSPIVSDIKKLFKENQTVLEARMFFYKWLKTVRDWLCSHPVQVKRSCYNVPNIRNWGNGRTGREECSENISIQIKDQQDLDHFLRHVCLPQGELQDYKEITNVSFDEAMIKALNVILYETLVHKPQFKLSRKKNSVLVKGSFVSLKEVLDGLPNQSELEKLVVLAKHTVFFDVDIDKTGQCFKIAVIAPLWEVIGVRKVCLDGAAVSELPKVKGKSGRPGLPGGPGGSFLGVGETILGGSQLRVSCCGGKGGPGEAGASGKEGQKGKHAKKASLFGTPEAKRVTEKGWVVTIVYNWKTDHLEGFDGQPGGTGEDGGAGGEGGAAGTIALFRMGPERASVGMKAAAGHPGEAGSGGPGGRGGMNGLSADQHLNLLLFLPFWRSMSDMAWRDDIRGEEGSEGRTGANEIGRKQRDEKVRVFGKGELAAVLKDFQSVLDGGARIRRSSMADRLVGREVTTPSQNRCHTSSLVTAGGDCHLPEDLYSFLSDENDEAIDVATDALESGAYLAC